MGGEKWTLTIGSFKLTPVTIEGQMGTETQTKCPKKKQRTSLACSHPKRRAVTIPKGLIGAKITAQVALAGKECNSLLDSGSQVTTVPKSFYDQNLSHLPIKSLYNLLEVEAANGQDVPYLGYIEVNVTFPKSALGVEIEVPTLALIVPDMHSTSSSVLIGTNTLDILYDLYSSAVPQDCQSLPYGYKAVLKTLEMRHRQQVDCSLAVVRLSSKDPESWSNQSASRVSHLQDARCRKVGSSGDAKNLLPTRWHNGHKWLSEPPTSLTSLHTGDPQERVRL